LTLGIGLGAFALAGCPGGDDDDDSVPVPILDPEPAGAPVDVADGFDLQDRTTLGCLGHNQPEAPSGLSLQLPGWVRTFADPANAAKNPDDTPVGQPAAEGEAFNEDGLSVGSAFSDTANGRIAITVPIRETGFLGSTVVTSTIRAGWTWLVTQEEVDTLATAAGLEADPEKGVLVGSVHDCQGFGVANAVIRYAETTTDGVFYFDQTEGPNVQFELAAEQAFTTQTGRFAIPNVTPGIVAVEAYGRMEAGGPLLLLSRTEIQVEAGKVAAVGLEPRIGALR
jgi:hypothetical protein